MIYHSHGQDRDDHDLHGLEREIAAATLKLRAKNTAAKFDGIVVQGMSGVIPGVPVALALGKPIVIVRKDSDDSHAFTRFINAGKIKLGSRWLFLDDFVSEGATRNRVFDAITSMGGTWAGEYMTRNAELTLKP